MLTFLSLINARSAIEDASASVQQAIQFLRSKTNYATFYELFNQTEGAKLQNIQKEFRKALKKEFPVPGMTKKEGEELLTTAYNILTKHRSTYDYFLKYHTFPAEMKKIGLGYYILLFVFLFFIFDLFYMFYRIRRDDKMSKKDIKKMERKGQMRAKIALKELYSVKMVSWVKGKIFG